VKQPKWVLRETVLLLHEQSLADFGGSPGIRDEGLLDSALDRPKNLLAYGNPGIFDMAASYGFGLAKNHPFIDGNKRTAFLVAILFIELNGFVFHAEEADATVQVLALAAGATDEKDFSAWLKRNSKRA
jgi:death-on-curing protein